MTKYLLLTKKNTFLCLSKTATSWRARGFEDIRFKSIYIFSIIQNMRKISNGTVSTHVIDSCNIYLFCLKKFYATKIQRKSSIWWCHFKANNNSGSIWVLFMIHLFNGLVIINFFKYGLDIIQFWLTCYTWNILTCNMYFSPAFFTCRKIVP